MTTQKPAESTQLGQKSVQLDLFEAQVTAIQITNFSMRQQSLSLLRYLVDIKQLPAFYFKDAAKELCLTSKDHRVEQFQGYRDNPRPVIEHRNTMAILLRVYLRIFTYPEQESYPTALQNLRNRYHELKDKGFSHNKISQHLRMSHHALTEAVAPPEDGKQQRPRHCPWEMLTRLETAEQDIDRKPVSRRESAIYIEDEREVPLPDESTLGFTYIERYDPCGHCGAPSHNLKFDEYDVYGNQIFQCVICSKVNRIRPKKPANSL